MLSYLNLTSHPQLTIANSHLMGCSKFHDSSEWFKQQTTMVACLNLISHSQLTIGNFGAGCLLPVDDGSFKSAVEELLQGILIALNSLNKAKHVA